MKSKNGNNDECFLAASLAIVDGTRLCLLPPFDTNDSKNGGNKRKRHRSSAAPLRSSSSSRSGNCNSQPMPDADEDEVYITVPTLPLSSVWKICVTGCISGSTSEEENVNIAGSEKETRGVAAELPPIETFRLRVSDLSNSEYRFNRSVSLVNGSTLSPMRVILSDETEEGMIALSDDMHYVEICLPSTTSDFASHGNEENECSLYGGENYNILGDDDSMINKDHGRNDPSTFEVHGAGSCLVADFLGIAGYEQALISPRVNKSLLSSMWNSNSKNDESIPPRTQLLRILLQNSFLMHGSGIFPSKHLKQLFFKAKTDNILSIDIPPLGMQSKMVVGTEKSLELQSNDETSCSENLSKGGILLPSPDQSKGENITKKRYHSIDANNDEKDSSMSQEDPAWLEAIAQTVEHRLGTEVEKSDQIERSTQVRSELVNQGRKTLHAGSRCNFSASTTTTSNSLDWIDPEIFRLRYGTRPRTSMETCGGMSVMLDLELDVTMRSILGSDESSSNKQKSSIANVMHNFHLCCNHFPLHSSSATTPMDIRTVSALVPTLQPGDCITVLASVLLNDLEMILEDSSEAPMLGISIQGLWDLNPANKHARHGAVLCILRLPVNALFITPSVTSAPRSGHWIQHEIDFTSHNDAYFHPVPSAIFEYRQPCTLIVDTSCEMNSAQDATMWKELVSNLNASIGGNSFVDLYCKKGDTRMKLVIFGSNPEERAATVKLVLYSLPESAKLITEDPDEKENVKALLMSLKNEAGTLRRHCSLPSKQIQPELLAEIATLQIHTDGVASTIKRGWA